MRIVTATRDDLNSENWEIEEITFEGTFEEYVKSIQPPRYISDWREFLQKNIDRGYFKVIEPATW